MKLAEALLLRSEYQTKIETLQHRIITNLKVQEGEKAHEDPQELLNEAFLLNDELCVLVKKINACNNTATLPDGRTLAVALVDRDALMKKRSLLASIASAASEKDYRLTHTEVKMLLTLPIGSVQKQIDDISKQFRELDTQIQGLNWTVDLD